MLRSSITKVAGRVVARPSSSSLGALRISAPRCFYSSWGDHGSRGTGGEGTAQPWQAQGAFDIQRVTQQAIIHELVTQQTYTIQNVVPWFLQNMPPPYFRQVPEKFRMDHIKAIAAIKGMYDTNFNTDLVAFL